LFFFDLPGSDEQGEAVVVAAREVTPRFFLWN
jgi:hypothetical protein